MKYYVAGLAFLAALAFPCSLAVAQTMRRLAPNVVLAMPVAADMASDGAAVVADMSGPAVHYVAPDGKQKWSLTAKGSGPGDVLRPYRVAIGEGTVWVYDYSVRDVSVFSRSGKFIRRVRLSLALTVVDDIVAIGDSLLAVLGTTRHAGHENHAIHVFDGMGVHKRSFGDVAFAVDRTKLSMSGTGTLARTARNTLLYVRKGPYQLLEYGVDGQLVRTLPPPIAIAAVVDSIVRIETNDEGRERISSRAAEIRFPVRAVPLSNGLVLSGVSDRGTLRWWLHSPGDSTVPVSLPQGLSPSSWNPKTCELVALTELDDEPALVAVEGRKVFPSTNINTMGCKQRSFPISQSDLRSRFFLVPPILKPRNFLEPAAMAAMISAERTT
ncbi:MAG: hypothetical protein IBJ03_15490 [Gemmatimonadaceae bacterium]|nr:hypothetical protein [Gemmatimonadaceae bacterium]